MKAITLAFLAAAAVTACASSTAEPRVRGIAQYAEDPRLGEETNRICFASGIDGFSMNERETVLLHDGKKRYMVEVTGSCFSLQNAEVIAIDNTTSCLTPGDSLIVAELPGASVGPRRCMIRSINTWDPKGEKAEAPEENPA